ncbi:MAG: hypothetical protein LC802_20925 [Acidobacteria bacterium]|nr:hypothetical protein [Acidobacteriota bacterium]
MNRKKKRVRYQPRLYRSDDLLDILAGEIPITEQGLLEVLGLLARRKVIVNPHASLRRPALPDDHLLVNETRSDELEDVETDWRTVFNDVRQRMEQLSCRIEQVAATSVREARPVHREEAVPRAPHVSPEELPELYWKAIRFLVNPLEMIAAIIGETYAEAGEDAVFADDEALIMIRDLLLDVDVTIIERTRGTNITAKSLSWLRSAESSPSLTTERYASACVSSQEESS